MKIDRQELSAFQQPVKHRFTDQFARIAVGLAITVVTSAVGVAQQESPSPGVPAIHAAATEGTSDSNAADRRASHQEANQQQAAQLIERVIDRLANGQAFDCKLRQRVRTAGREVVGVGTYLQVGSGTGQFYLQIKMHDGDGKHTLQQISDGRLAWTRSEIAGTVSLSRVDVGWLDEGSRTLRGNQRVKPSMRVGGPSEMLDTIRRDYDLKLGTSSLDGQPLSVIIGSLKPSRREAVKALQGGADLPNLYPTRVNVAIAQVDDPESGFGKGLPIRIEHLSDPIALSDDPNKELESQIKRRRMISLLEFYSVRPVAPPPIQRFRFENQDTEVDFVNETSRYEERFDIRVSAKDRAKYR
jgi:hypothetical protein